MMAKQFFITEDQFEEIRRRLREIEDNRQDPYYLTEWLSDELLFLIENHQEIKGNQ